MIEGSKRDVTEEEIREYRETGVVRLKRILDDAWVKRLGDALDEVFSHQQDSVPMFYDVTESALQLEDGGIPVLHDDRARSLKHRGRYLTAIGGWTVNQGIRAVALESPLGYIAGRLFRASKVNFYDDQLLTKESGAREYTAFHTDEPYYHLRGDQVCGIWVSPDPVDADSGAMQYVRGSHRWPSFFKPNLFASQATLDTLGGAESVEEQVPLPDIEGNREDYDIVMHPSEPGDVIVHHSRLIHGSGPNYTTGSLRRAASSVMPVTT